MWEKITSVNLNYLFPRLSITAKLAIAFVLLALVPLILVSAMGTVFTVEQMRAREQELLEHDLETVGQRTARSLRELAQQVAYAADLGLEERVLGGPALPTSGLVAAVASYLAADSSALFRVKLVNATGDVVAVVRRPGSERADGEERSQPF
ncbi:MAG: hypothetical protein GWM92_04255, partial [Gemmatimonadetes bacterium]|nr:cell division protein FtsL [Gemmatimonadota bacterium]NIR77773.1 cell division protein FtsL [Gemmatimonadota bacterium]NIT86309.1 cell division protein FtsL [Gemmatimonadota bacterium]NIU30143.1 cell division protein FtsL [Gemmatimonadota bacterium]NIU35083.1 hypothetical protein [Gemmatimonadota bacterium]